MCCHCHCPHLLLNYKPYFPNQSLRPFFLQNECSPYFLFLDCIQNKIKQMEMVSTSFYTTFFLSEISGIDGLWLQQSLEERECRTRNKVSLSHTKSNDNHLSTSFQLSRAWLTIYFHCVLSFLFCVF